MGWIVINSLRRSIDWSKRHLRCQYSVTERRNMSWNWNCSEKYWDKIGKPKLYNKMQLTENSKPVFFSVQVLLSQGHLCVFSKISLSPKDPQWVCFYIKGRREPETLGRDFEEVRFCCCGNWCMPRVQKAFLEYYNIKNWKAYENLMASFF